VAEFYAEILGRAVDDEEFGRLDRIFHDAYRVGLTSMMLPPTRWRDPVLPGSQSLLSCGSTASCAGHPDVRLAGVFTRVDGLRTEVGGHLKAGHLAAHLDELGIPGNGRC